MTIVSFVFDTSEASLINNLEGDNLSLGVIFSSIMYVFWEWYCSVRKSKSVQTPQSYLRLARELVCFHKALLYIFGYGQPTPYCLLSPTSSTALLQLLVISLILFFHIIYMYYVTPSYSTFYFTCRIIGFHVVFHAHLTLVNHSLDCI